MTSLKCIYTLAIFYCNVRLAEMTLVALVLCTHLIYLCTI